MKLGMITHLLRISSKIDARPIVKHFKGLDIISNDQAAGQESGAKIKLNKEQMATVAFELAAELLPQLTEDIGKDIIMLVAAHKDLPIEEAERLDMIEAIVGVLTESGVMDFFSRRLSPDSEQKPVV